MNRAATSLCVLALLVGALYIPCSGGKARAEGAGEVELRPFCSGWLQAFESTSGVLILVPLVAARTEQTRVEVWVRIAPGKPEGEVGWYQASEHVPAGWFVWWDRHNLEPGPHAITAEVFENEQRVDGWQRVPSTCMVMVETR